MTNSQIIQRAGHPLTRDRAVSPAGILGFWLAVFYAVFVRFYQSAGGRIGLSSEPGTAAKWASYVAGLLVLVGGAACLVLTHRSLRRVPRVVPYLGDREAPRGLMVVICVAPTLLGAVIAVSHGAGGGLANLLELLGAGTASIHADAAPHPRADLLWEVLFYEPWFLAMGTCLLLSCIEYLKQSSFSRRTTRAVLLAGVASCAAIATLFLLAAMLHWNLDIEL